MKLIDADKLIEDIKEIDMQYMYSPKGFINVVNSQPTAFDVDKVVEQLEGQRKEYEESADSLTCDYDRVCYYRGKMRAYEYSKEIVKAGGIDD